MVIRDDFPSTTCWSSTLFNVSLCVGLHTGTWFEEKELKDLLCARHCWLWEMLFVYTGQQQHICRLCQTGISVFISYQAPVPVVFACSCSDVWSNLVLDRLSSLQLFNFPPWMKCHQYSQRHSMQQNIGLIRKYDLPWNNDCKSSESKYLTDYKHKSFSSAVLNLRASALLRRRTPNIFHNFALLF